MRPTARSASTARRATRTWQTSIRIEDKEKLRLWAKDGNVCMTEQLRQMIEREGKKRKRRGDCT